MLGSSAVGDAGSCYVESATAARKLESARCCLSATIRLINRLNVIGEFNRSPLRSLCADLSTCLRYSSIKAALGRPGKRCAQGNQCLSCRLAGDQYDNGARIVRLGVGRVMMRNQYRADRAAVELKQLLESPNYMKKAATIGQQIQQENECGSV